MSSISINYHLGKNGWSHFQLSLGDKMVDVGAFGYCSDALGDLVRCALLIATSDFHAEVRLDGEPCEWRLIIDEGWKPERRLRVLFYPESDLPEAEGRLLIEGIVAADDFARAVQRAAQGIWDTYGADGYNEVWMGQRGFPLRGLKALDAALSYEEPSPSEPS